MNETTKCLPCSSDFKPLARGKCEEYLVALPGWELADEARAIEKKYAFKNFAAAMNFAVKAGDLAEQMGHHPVLTVGWGFCRVRFKTSKINGLHENDFVMAAQVEKLPR
ncbi:MAG TPA: pterin-4-alpha-carbinolamine dehydratase [Candidatus Riflebacteria bacterium]|jgi:4a-hydroxytetrahydrobiopterin dehydratase|nr:pterin-4-alpha-carbinolamine dehydratase [Candidatus Riflebacteria bacterium]